MMNTKLFFTLILLTIPALGMEQAKNKLKVDLLFAHHASAVKSGTFLHVVYDSGSHNGSQVKITEPFIRECVSRGIDLNRVDSSENTVLCKAIQIDRESSLEDCNVLYSCGASPEYPFMRVLERLRRDNTGPRNQRKASQKELLCGSMWLEQQRKKLFMTYLCSMRSIKVFPRDIVRLILSRCTEILPSHCLHQFYSQAQIENITTQREQEVLGLFSEMGVQSQSASVKGFYVHQQKKPRNA